MLSALLFEMMGEVLASGFISQLFHRGGNNARQQLGFAADTILLGSSWVELDVQCQ